MTEVLKLSIELLSSLLSLLEVCVLFDNSRKCTLTEAGAAVIGQGICVCREAAEKEKIRAAVHDAPRPL
jgi:hypothetical protein